MILRRLAMLAAFAPPVAAKTPYYMYAVSYTHLTLPTIPLV